MLLVPQIAIYRTVKHYSDDLQQQTHVLVIYQTHSKIPPSCLFLNCFISSPLSALFSVILSQNFVWKDLSFSQTLMSPPNALTGKINSGHIINADPGWLLLMHERLDFTHSGGITRRHLLEVFLG